MLWEKEKLLISSNLSFSYSVFKRLVLQTHENQGLFGKGLTMNWVLFLHQAVDGVDPIPGCTFCAVLYRGPVWLSSKVWES